MRNLAVAVGVIALALAAMTFAFPEQTSALSQGGMMRVLYLMLAALLVGSGLFGMGGVRADGRWLWPALFWIFLIAAITMIARAVSLS